MNHLEALRTIAEYPASAQDDMQAANMRKIAQEALAGGVERLRSGVAREYPPINIKDFNSDSDLACYLDEWRRAGPGADAKEKFAWILRHLAKLMHAYADADRTQSAPTVAEPAAEPVAIPDGWRLVPIRLTQAMADAAKTVDGRLSVWKYDDAYQAMLANAPEAPAPAPNALDAETAIKNCLEAGETMRVLKRVVNLLLESRRNLGPEDHELRDRIDQLFRPDAAIAAQSAQGAKP